MGKALQVRLASKGHQKAMTQAPSHRWVKVCDKMTPPSLFCLEVHLSDAQAIP